MKVGTTALIYWLLLSSCTSPGSGPLCVTPFATGITNRLYKSIDYYYHGHGQSRPVGVTYFATGIANRLYEYIDYYYYGHGERPSYGNTPDHALHMYNEGGVGSSGPGSSGNSPSDLDDITNGIEKEIGYAGEGERRGAFTVDLTDDGLVFDVQDVDNDIDSNYEQKSISTFTSEPRVVEAECIESINAKSEPNKLREIAEKEGHDTSNMGQEELEKIARWVQSKQFQKIDELREIAQKEGYDTTGMGQEELDRTARWVQSPGFQVAKELREKAKEFRETAEKEGSPVSGQTKYSSVPLEELQAVAHREGYDSKGMDRADLEQIMDWVQSQQYHERKQQLEEKNDYHSKLREIVEKEGYDTTDMTPDKIEKTAHWVRTEQFQRKKEEARRKKDRDDAGQGPGSGQSQSKWVIGESVGNNSGRNTRTSGTGEESAKVDLSQVIEVQAVDDDNDRESVFLNYDQDYFKPKYLPDFIRAKRETSKVGEMPEKETYDSVSLGQEKLEKAARWLQSTRLQLQIEKEQSDRTRDRASNYRDQNYYKSTYQASPRIVQTSIHTKFEPNKVHQNSDRAGNYIYDQNNFKSTYQASPRIVQASIHTKFEPNTVHEIADIHTNFEPYKVREIAEREGYGTSNRRQDKLEKAARWIQSQRFPKLNEQANRKWDRHNTGQGPSQRPGPSQSLSQGPSSGQTKYFSVPLEEHRADRKQTFLPHKSALTSKPRVVEAECIDRINAKREPNKVLEIFEKEAHDTTDMGKGDVEQITRWIQSQRFQKEKEKVNRNKDRAITGQDPASGQTKYSSVPLEELQAVAEREGYDSKGMDRGDLEQIMDWVSQQYHKQKQDSEEYHHHHRHSRSGDSNSLYSHVSTIELQEIASKEGYNVDGLDRAGLESIVEWVHSQRTKGQKEPLKSQSSNRGLQHGRGSSSPSPSPSPSLLPSFSKFASMSIQDLQVIACKGGYDINLLGRRDLEKVAEWVSSQEYKQN